MRRVLITGARAPVALDLATSFERAGFETHLADSVRPWTALLSGRWRGRLHALASPRFAFERFVDDLARLAAMLEPELIIPTCEEVFYVAVAAARLGLAERVFAPPPALLRRLHSKVEFASLARDCGVEAPATERVTSAAQLATWRDRARDIVIKPEYSRFASHAHVRPSPAELTQIVPTEATPWAVQAFVPGEELCIWSAVRAGEVVAIGAYRPSWRLGRSASYYFETDHDPALLAFVRGIAASLGVSGQLSFDVIRRPDGVIVPIECNPRTVSGVHLFDSDPRVALAIAGEAGLQEPQAEARHLAPAMWLLGAPSALISGRLGAFAEDLRRSRDVFGELGGGRVAAGALLDAGRFTLVGLSRGRSGSGQSTDDIEWNGEAIG